MNMKMKRIGLILAMLAISTFPAFAASNERNWATAGKVLAITEGLRILSNGSIDALGIVTGVRHENPVHFKDSTSHYRNPRPVRPAHPVRPKRPARQSRHHKNSYRYVTPIVVEQHRVVTHHVVEKEARDIQPTLEEARRVQGLMQMFIGKKTFFGGYELNSDMDAGDYLQVRNATPLAQFNALKSRFYALLSDAAAVDPSDPRVRQLANWARNTRVVTTDFSSITKGEPIFSEQEYADLGL
jgi:hypothetical protein